jgi:hypothetical protein
MSSTELDVLSKGRMTITPHLEGHALGIEISGICDAVAVQGLGAFLAGAATEVERLDLEKVIIDVRAVSLLSSSCIKQLITFLRPVKAGQLRCRVQFLVDAETPWQRRSMGALVRMCPAAVSLRSADGAGPAGPGRTNGGRPLSAAPGPS